MSHQFDVGEKSRRYFIFSLCAAMTSLLWLDFSNNSSRNLHVALVDDRCWTTKKCGENESRQQATKKNWNSSSRRMLSGKEFTMLVAWSLIKLVSVWMLLLQSTAHVKSALWQSGTSQLHRSCAGVEHNRRRLQLLRCSRTVGYKHLLVTGYLIDK